MVFSLLLLLGQMPLASWSKPQRYAKGSEAVTQEFPGAVSFGDKTGGKAAKDNSAAINNSPSKSEDIPLDVIHDPEAANDQVEKSTAVAPAAVELKDQQDALEHYEIARHYLNNWELELGEVELDEANQLDPGLEVIHRDLCLVALQRLEIPRSIAELMMVIGLGEPVLLSAKEKLTLDARAYKLHYKDALNWGKKQQWSDAISELRWAETYEPNNPAVHHSLAFAYASLGDIAKAEKEYATTFSQAPGDAFAHADFANLLSDVGNKQQAENELRKAVELDPNAAALHIDLGWMAEARGDAVGATAEFQKAVTLSPKHAGLWDHLGRLLERTGQIEQAENAFNRAVALDPQQTEAKESLERLKATKHSGA